VLLALLNLASVAHRVGQIGRHTISPPLEALLDLARAAENYTASNLAQVGSPDVAAPGQGLANPR
jgi:hypothetical protein